MLKNDFITYRFTWSLRFFIISKHNFSSLSACIFHVASLIDLLLGDTCVCMSWYLITNIIHYIITHTKLTVYVIHFTEKTFCSIYIKLLKVFSQTVKKDVLVSYWINLYVWQNHFKSFGGKKSITCKIHVMQ